MEDFQFIIYLIIGAIYIISRALKGKNKNNQPQQRPPRRPQPTQNKQQSQSQPPKSFEDILAEFGKRMEEQIQPEVIEVQEEKPIVQQAPKPKVQPAFEEGRTRRFADEESRRIYEESIVRSEGADLKFEANQKYKTDSLKMGFSAYDKEKEENEFAKEIRESLSDSDSAKKAVILSEILNRRY
ncbi:MAG: hypothetical protein NXI20_07505 [bacterium]|nr:hypothetical protein [bacterium]